MIHLVLSVLLQHWVVVNDIHLDPFSTRGVIYGSDTTPELFKSALHAMHETVPDARVVLLGGDMLSHHFVERAHAAGKNAVTSAIETDRTIAKDLSEAFPRAQFLVAQGNNDDPCGDYRSEVGGSYEEQLARVWEPLVNRRGAAPNFASDFYRGGYYAARLPIRNGRAIVLNSVFWSFVYRGGCLSSPHDPGTAELTWLRTELSRLGPATNAMILMHIPPGYDPQSTDEVDRIVDVPFLSSGRDRAFISLVSDRANALRFIVGAHTHRYDFRIVGGVPMLIASSISPIYVNNPAFYELDVDENGNIHDIQPFVYDPYMDDWERKPSFDAMYNVNGFTRNALETISANILDGNGNARDAWIEAYTVWTTDTDHIGATWLTFACAQTELDKGYASCVGTTERSRKITVIAIGSFILLVLLAWVIWHGRRESRRVRL